MTKVYLCNVPNPSYIKAIRQKCLECSENSPAVRDCHIVKCPLWAFRFGKGFDSSKAYLERHGYDVEEIDIKKYDYVEEYLKTKKRRNRF